MLKNIEEIDHLRIISDTYLQLNLNLPTHPEITRCFESLVPKYLVKNGTINNGNKIDFS
jgi:hypothetical protein